ncbi:ATP-dependent RNA helicase DDX54/DBP1 [Nematocida displodere]|uniref:ATP-dependent RNA helicase n=1 Tax=Nematocida displodere TaxID=1805483 RepID=A0A177EAC8_9MICR|nr:ATP-dependent RNA helicase DDX54/DBP1 [Nematocida displodere]
MDFGVGLDARKRESATFKGMNIPIEILGNIKYPIATPIQRKIIPKMLNGEDVIAVSRTGSGKTYAYVIPILMRLLERKEVKTIYTRAKAIIVVPTYELATQVFSVVQELSHNGVHPAMLTGIASLAHSFNYLVVGQFEIAICTPGRLEHILTELSSADRNRPIYLKIDEKNTKREVCITDAQLLEKLTQPDIVIIDEMDRIFEDKSLSLSLERILGFFTNTPQYGMFSATHHKGNNYIREILNRRSIEVTEILGGVSDHLEMDRLKINNFFIQEEMKLPLLMSLIRKAPEMKVLVFVSTCKRCLVVSEALRESGVSLGVLSSAESEESRDLVVKDFKKGDISVLISTDVGCRGLDIKGISMVIDYDYASCRSTAIHRVGRMNRGRSETGILYSFIRPGDILTYLSFLNHVHAEKPRDATRHTRLCFSTTTCINDDEHKTCSYLGIGHVPSDFYASTQETARAFLSSQDAGYAGSYVRYAKTNPPEKMDPKWIVPCIDIKTLPSHPYFGISSCTLSSSIKNYKSRYNPMITSTTHHLAKQPRPAIKREAPVKVNLDKFKDPSFIPYENIRSGTFSGGELPTDKSSQIKDRIRKHSKPAGQIFTEWKKENRDRLCKGHLLKRPAPLPEEEEKKPGVRMKEGATHSIKKVLSIRQRREKDHEERSIKKRKQQRQ